MKLGALVSTTYRSTPVGTFSNFTNPSSSETPIANNLLSLVLLSSKVHPLNGKAFIKGGKSISS